MVPTAVQAAKGASQLSSGPSLAEAPAKRVADDPYEFLSSDEDAAPAAPTAIGEALAQLCILGLAMPTMGSTSCMQWTAGAARTSGRQQALSRPGASSPEGAEANLRADSGADPAQSGPNGQHAAAPAKGASQHDPGFLRHLVAAHKKAREAWASVDEGSSEEDGEGASRSSRPSSQDACMPGSRPGSGRGPARSSAGSPQKQAYPAAAKPPASGRGMRCDSASAHPGSLTTSEPPDRPGSSAAQAARQQEQQRPEEGPEEVPGQQGAGQGAGQGASHGARKRKEVSQDATEVPQPQPPKAAVLASATCSLINFACRSSCVGAA
jgi:hypothetical protein